MYYDARFEGAKVRIFGEEMGVDCGM